MIANNAKSFPWPMIATCLKPKILAQTRKATIEAWVRSIKTHDIQAFRLTGTLNYASAADQRHTLHGPTSHPNYIPKNQSHPLAGIRKGSMLVHRTPQRLTIWIDLRFSLSSALINQPVQKNEKSWIQSVLRQRWFHQISALIGYWPTIFSTGNRE